MNGSGCEWIGLGMDRVGNGSGYEWIGLGMDRVVLNILKSGANVVKPTSLDLPRGDYFPMS